MINSTDYIRVVEITNRQKEISLITFLPFIPEIISATLSVEKTKAEYIGVSFLSDRTMRRYHLKYFNDPSPTDCMSFPIDGKDPLSSEERWLGDIFVCPKVALCSAKKEKCSLEKELALYIIHATLHLLGYDDIKKQDIKIMRQKEEEVFDFLRKNMKELYGTLSDSG